MVTFLKNPNRILRRTNDVVVAWRQLAPETTFAGMTLAQFESEVAPSQEVRVKIAELEAEMSAAIGRRALADLVTNEKLKLVVNAVKGSPGYGENSDLYRAMGYVPAAERATGLTRRNDVAAPAAVSAN